MRSGVEATYFAQFTDLHVGERGLNSREAAWNLAWALDEVAALQPRPEAIVVTGDLVCGGTRAELETYRRLVSLSQLPVHALPANHDRWGEEDDAAWTELVGPLRQRVDVGELVVLLWDDVIRDGEARWPARLGEEQRRWLEAQVRAAGQRPIIVAHHVPILPVNGDYHDKWAGSDANEVVRLLQGYGVVATITGHWHRTGEWRVGGLRVITTGALCGWQWTGVPPHLCFPTRPGYRLFCYRDGELHTFWREGSYWQQPAPVAQVTLESVGGVHTGGPRPQVRPPTVTGCVELVAKSFVMGGDAQAVEWSFRRGEWQAMRRTWRGLWDEWQAQVDTRQLRPWGPYTLAVRLIVDGRTVAVDAVPVTVAERDASPFSAAAALPGAEMVWAMFYPPDGD